MKVTYKTKLTPEDIKTRLSTIIESPNNVSNKKVIFVGKIDKTDNFHIQKHFQSVKFFCDINGIIKEKDDYTTIKVQIKSSDGHPFQPIFPGFFPVASMICMIMFIPIMGITEYNFEFIFSFLGFIILFFIWVHETSKAINETDEIKMQLKDLFEAEIEQL
jgi:hypothetical protein